MLKYFNDICQSPFCRHHYTVKSSDLLMTIRGYQTPAPYDLVLTQAFLEVRHSLPYGPFSFESVHSDGKETIWFKYNNMVAIMAEIKADMVFLMYIREKDLCEWGEELCAFAYAHFKLHSLEYDNE